jgi:hypothetical protein
VSPFRCYVAVLAVLIALGLQTKGFSQPWAAKMFETTTHDFGSVSRNAKAEFEFVIENIYEEDVHISSVRSSCGCTKPSITKNTLKTWEKGSILAQFNTRSFIGYKNAAITVVIDQPYYAEIQLMVKGHIRSDIVTDPGEIHFGDVDQGGTKTIPLRISFAGSSQWTVMDVRGKSDHLKVKLDPPIKRNGGVSYVMQVSLLPTAPIGEVFDELIVVTNDRNDNEFTLPVTGRVVPPISIAPALLNLGSVGPNIAKQQRFVVKGNKPFKITSVECDDDRFVFEVPTESKAIQIVPFAFNSTEEQGEFRKSIKVTTDMGEAIIAECLITGQVTR